MSANATATARIADGANTVPDAERGHRVRLYALYVVAIASQPRHLLLWLRLLQTVVRRPAIFAQASHAAAKRTDRPLPWICRRGLVRREFFSIRSASIGHGLAQRAARGTGSIFTC